MIYKAQITCKKQRLVSYGKFSVQSFLRYKVKHHLFVLFLFEIINISFIKYRSNTGKIKILCLFIVRRIYFITVYQIKL